MNTIPIFPPSTTANPLTMGDNVAFLIEYPGHPPAVLVKTHREICDAMDEWRGVTFDPSEVDCYLEDYCDSLESEHPGLEENSLHYWVDRHGLALAVQGYSESGD